MLKKRAPLAIPLSLLTAATGLAGCSSDKHESGPSGKPASSSPTAADQAMVAWVSKVCAADSHVQQMAGTEVPTTSNPPRAQVRAFIKNIGQQLRLGVTTFEGIGHAPVAGGDEVVAAYIRGLKDRIPDIKRAESFARGSGSMMAAGANLPLLYVSTALHSLAPKGPDLLSLVDRNAALAQAYRTAPPCQRSLPLKAHSPTPTPSR
ncbi:MULTISPECIES: hypothetical protein [Actinomadura]|uniref:Lipoprotein n=1 Tax=Actinomadura yumaensis TaxID=111807 RepID=A0ABW2CLA0_9ACTN|nr:hypothetical protein [Actinomadura sp. J1-007]MWK37078.1 hypothetical protein [Actinomadura sp. J1-007]